MLVFEYGMTGSSVDSSVVVRLSCTGASSGCFRGSKSVTPDVSELLDLAVCFGPRDRFSRRDISHYIQLHHNSPAAKQT
jgi:hypothetical protein